MFLYEFVKPSCFKSIEQKIDEAFILNEFDNPCLVVGEKAYYNFKKLHYDGHSSIFEHHKIVELLLSEILTLEIKTKIKKERECNFIGLMYGRIPIFVYKSSRYDCFDVYLEEMDGFLVNRFLRFGLKEKK